MVEFYWSKYNFQKIEDGIVSYYGIFDGCGGVKININICRVYRFYSVFFI